MVFLCGSKVVAECKLQGWVYTINNKYKDE